MDIVDLTRVFLQIIIKEVLQNADSQFTLALVEHDGARLFARVPFNREAFGTCAGLFKRFEQLLRFGFEDHTVDGLEDLCRVVDILKFHECIARRMVGEVNTGIVLLKFFVAGLCGCEGMVAVADSKNHGRTLEAGVLLADGGGILGQGLVEVFDVLALDEPAGDVAAVLHEIEIIDLLERILLRGDRLDELLVVVVAEHQHVRQLDGRVAADTLAGRDALRHGALGGADGAGRAGGVVIRVEVDHADKALADGAVLQRALDIDKAVGVDCEHAVFHVFFHRGVDLGSVFRFFLGAEFGFGEDQVDGGHSTLGIFAHTVPVRLIRRKLIAGNDRPFFHMVCFGHQDISG